MQFQRILRFGLSALILLALMIDTLGWHQYPYLTKLENWTYDARLNSTRPNSLDNRIVILDIDENSLAVVGQWPWGRDKLATIVDNLFEYYQVDTVGFDISFVEKDQSSGIETFEELASGELSQDQAYQAALERIRPSLQHDRIFAKSLLGRNLVMGYIFENFDSPDQSHNTGSLPPATMKIDAGWSERLQIIKPSGYIGNLEILQSATEFGGYFDNPLVDADGVFRRVPLIQAYDNHLYSSLALAVSQAHLDKSKIDLVIETDGISGAQDYYVLEGINLGEHHIPVDNNGAVYVPYRGPQGSFPYLPLHQVLSKEIKPALLQDKIVLIGTTAPGLKDLRSTPVAEIYAGVEIHANIISGILDGTINHKPAWIIAYEFLMLIVLATGMALLLPLLSPLMAAAGTIGISLLTILITMIAWNNHLILPLASPLMLIGLIFILDMTFGFFIESRDKRQLTHLFGQYIPPELVDEMAEDPTDFAIDGENREMTVLFSDVRGFTTISEGMDPKQLVELMNALLTPMTRVIHKNRGTIDKYMGDAIMSFWGAPLRDPEHARHALDAALEMMDELKIMQMEFKERGWPEVNMGIGLNTGNMNVGNMGSEFRMAYTVLGDAVNLGSRLEGLTKTYGVNIIVSETTKDSISGFTFRELDLVTVLGKNEPVAIFEPVGHENDLDERVISELTNYKRALREFRLQNWDEAEEEFSNLGQADSDRQLYQIYLDRISHFRREPPGDDWDGVFTHTTK
ncbi:MAG: adenylate/guanylate cyclase domain-containing protein [Proteobacteria bacterium]|nr:adenylate/guanylate cyclase domain-containing protein [Pseudomonadota bacterium]